jgi:hypothetical protein
MALQGRLHLWEAVAHAIEAGRAAPVNPDHATRGA